MSLSKGIPRALDQGVEWVVFDTHKKLVINNIMSLKSSKSILRIILLLGMFILSIYFRLWFISLAPQLYGYDQYEYDSYAQKMLANPLLLASHSYRSYPFPLMLAIIYKIVGFANHNPIFWTNAILDSLSGLLVFWILKNTIKKESIAWSGLILYTFNPFTSGYVGVVLSEVLSAFTITATIALGLKFIHKPKAIWGILLGFLAGLSAETRNAAFAWAFVPIALTLISVSLKAYWRAYLGIILGVGITVAYPLYVNWRDWKEINISTVDSMFAREFFNGAILKILPPFNYVYPREVQLMYGEYYAEYAPWRTKAERKAMYDKYWQKGWAIIKKDPFDYFKYRFIKAVYVWQKENIFFYEEPNFNDHKQYTFTLNVFIEIFTVLGLWGLGKYIFSNKKWKTNTFYLWGCLLGTILYGTIFYCISHAEYRLTIPFYPLLIIASAVGLHWIFLVIHQGIEYSTIKNHSIFNRI